MIAFNALNRLESELLAVQGVAEALMLIALSAPEVREGMHALYYLARQLDLHRQEARAAFDEIFEAIKQKSAASPPPQNSGAPLPS